MPVRRKLAALAAPPLLLACLLAPTVPAHALPAKGRIPASHPSARKKPKFVHPGVQLSRADLDYVRKRLKKEPWKSAYKAVKKTRYASLTARPKPAKEIACGPFGAGSNAACTDERNDAITAYTAALLWYYGKDKRYLTQATRYLDAWSAANATRTLGDAPLAAAWSGQNWIRAAEIIRYTQPKGKKWKNEKRFSSVLRGRILPLIRNGYTANGMNGNWDLVMADATIGAGVYLNDRGVFDQAIKVLRSRVPAYFYLESDGDRPHQPSVPVWDIDGYWWQPCSETTNPLDPNPNPCGPGDPRPAYAEGMTQETCRDRIHPMYGIAATMQTAATAKIQGKNLYPELKKRLTAALEFQSKHWLTPVPAWLCGGKLNKALAPGLELGYQAYRKQATLSWTRKALLKQRPAGLEQFMAWETLTNAR
ncbi:alginate lyase family protein [Actinocorallia longicatena]|uniref:Alginate lyase family protein n=1 Tax=Actinocorallia longicatena TaxID=111803 RepID=A0ABP6QMC7_9ACTN